MSQSVPPIASARPVSTPAPGPSRWTVLRQLRTLRRDPLAYFARLQAEYGGLVRLPLPGETLYLVTAPDAV